LTAPAGRRRIGVVRGKPMVIPLPINTLHCCVERMEVVHTGRLRQIEAASQGADSSNRNIRRALTKK